MGEMRLHSALEAYEVAYHVLKASPELMLKESRKESKHPFKVFQSIAPYDGDGVPDESRFSQVLCRDLSQGGFSFVASEEPDYPTLVIALGDPPNQTHMVAEVVHFRQVRLLDGERIEIVNDPEGNGDDGREAPLFLVGCRFSGRLQ
jgi:hypothetical protein